MNQVCSTSCNNGPTIMDSIHYDVLAIILERIKKKSVESYCLRSTCPRLKFVLEHLLHHPLKISVRGELPSNLHLYNNLPQLTFYMCIRLHCNVLGRGYWETFEYLHAIHPSMQVEKHTAQLLWAVIRGEQMTCCQKLISKYAKPTKELFQQILFIAAECGSINFVEYALENMIVGERESMTLVEYAMKHFADNQHDYRRAFSIAVSNGHVDIAKLFVSICGNIFNNDIYICNAAKHGHLNVVMFLHSIGANARAMYNTPVRYAATIGDLELVKFLVSAGANARTDDDYALGVAANIGHLDLVKFLVSVGANIKANGNYAIRAAMKNGHYKVIQFFASHVDLSIDEHALLAAIKNNHVEMVRYVCSLHSHIIKLIGDKGIDIATTNNCIEMLQLLHSLGANLSCLDNCAIQNAAQNGNLPIVEFLYFMGVDVCASNDAALGLAAINGRLEVVKFLVSVGANVESCNGPVIESARKCRYFEVVRFLESFCKQ